MMSPELISAIIAGLVALTGGVGILIRVGGVNEKLNNTIKRVDGLDLEMKGLQSLMTDVAVMRSEITHTTHDIRNIKDSLKTLEKIAIEGRSMRDLK